MQTIVYLIRHAAYENPRQIFHGRLPGFPLSAKGKHQAGKIAQALRNKPLIAVYASPLTRAYQTAKIIAKPHHLRVVTDKRLMDIKSPLQGKPLAILHAAGFDVYQHKYIVAGGERLSQVYRRMQNFIREKVRKYAGSQIVVVSHGDPIMSVKFKYLGRRLYTRRPFEKDYLEVGQGIELIFGDRGGFRRLKNLSP